MGRKENDATDRIRNVLKRAGVWHFKHWGGKFGRKGVSDILGIRTMRVDDLVRQGVEEVGVFIAVEVKIPNHAWSKPTKEQQAFLESVNRAGGIGFVAMTPKEVIERLSLHQRLTPLFAEETDEV